MCEDFIERCHDLFPKASENGATVQLLKHLTCKQLDAKSWNPNESVQIIWFCMLVGYMWHKNRTKGWVTNDRSWCWEAAYPVWPQLYSCATCCSKTVWLIAKCCYLKNQIDSAVGLIRWDLRTDRFTNSVRDLYEYLAITLLLRFRSWVEIHSLKLASFVSFLMSTFF